MVWVGPYIAWIPSSHPTNQNSNTNQQMTDVWKSCQKCPAKRYREAQHSTDTVDLGLLADVLMGQRSGQDVPKIMAYEGIHRFVG